MRHTVFNCAICNTTRCTEDARPDPTTEEWFQIEYSRTGADDWFSEIETGDTLESARRKHGKRKADLDLPVSFEFRIVKKTLSTEVIEYLKG